MYMEQITERIGLNNGIAPQTLNNGFLNSDYVDLSKFKRALFILTIGANAGSVQYYLQEDSVTNFANSTNGVAGSFSNSGGNNVSRTGLTAASKIYTIEVRADQLSAGKRYVRLNVKENNVGNATLAVVGYGDDADSKKGSANNGTAVTNQDVVN